MGFDTSIIRAARIVNNTLGVICVYTINLSGDIIEDVDIIIDRNKEVTDDFGMIAGYRVEASILKSQINRVRNEDSFVDPSGRIWTINQIVKDTTAKWYVDIS